MQNELVIISEDDIRNKKYYIRGKEVMLDSDLARIYGYTTKDFNRQEKIILIDLMRNIGFN